MNLEKQKYPEISFGTLISFFLLLAAFTVGTVTVQEAAGQLEQQNTTNTTSIISNQTSSIANQTGATAMQNQTQLANQTQADTAAVLANLTQADFETITEGLAQARQALQNNDTNAVLDELNSASGELFQVISRQLDPAQFDAMTQAFNPLQIHIDQAQEAILLNNTTMTLEEMNSADSELLKITQTIPDGEEVDGG
jgi:hypothetical protein